MLNSNNIQIKSRAFKSNLIVVKSNRHTWFNRDLNQIVIWICPSLLTNMVTNRQTNSHYRRLYLAGCAGAAR